MGCLAAVCAKQHHSMCKTQCKCRQQLSELEDKTDQIMLHDLNFTVDFQGPQEARKAEKQAQGVRSH